MSIDEWDKIKEDEMKRKKNYKGIYEVKASIDPKMKLNGKNKTTAINTWAVVLFRYGTGILQSKES